MRLRPRGKHEPERPRPAVDLWDHQAEQLGVQPAGCHQVVVRAALGDLPVLQHITGSRPALARAGCSHGGTPAETRARSGQEASCAVASHGERGERQRGLPFDEVRCSTALAMAYGVRQQSSRRSSSAGTSTSTSPQRSSRPSRSCLSGKLCSRDARSASMDFSTACCVLKRRQLRGEDVLEPLHARGHELSS